MIYVAEGTVARFDHMKQDPRMEKSVVAAMAVFLGHELSHMLAGDPVNFNTNCMSQCIDGFEEMFIECRQEQTSNPRLESYRDFQGLLLARKAGFDIQASLNGYSLLLDPATFTALHESRRFGMQKSYVKYIGQMTE